MSLAAVPADDPKRRIGDILLQHGFVTEEELTTAVAEQVETDQPLGQILVQRGVITRLELASALAEQWSDQSSGFAPPAAPRKPASLSISRDLDEDQYAARLRDAVADLAERVRVDQPDGELEQRITDIAQRLEATVARTQRIEATLATLSHGLEAVTTGVEDAFAALQAGIADLAGDLARVDSTVAESLERPTEPLLSDPVLAQRIDELESTVRALSEQPAADVQARGQLDELQARLEAATDRVALDELHELLASLGLRVDALSASSAASADLSAQADVLEGIRSTLADLEGRVTGGSLETRIGHVEHELAERLASVAGVSDVEALAALLETTVSSQARIETSVAELGLRVEGLAAEGGREASPDPRVDALESRIEELASAVADARWPAADEADPVVSHRFEDLSAAVESVRTDLASLAELTSSVRGEELAARIEALESRLAAEFVTPAELAEAVEVTREDLAGRLAAPDGRIERLEEELTSIRGHLEDLDAAQPDPGVAGELEVLTAKLASVEDRLPSGLITSEGLADALAETRAAFVESLPEPDDRVDTLGEELAAVRMQIAELTSASDRDREVAGELEAVRQRVGQLAADLEAHASLAEKLESVENRLVNELVTSEELSRALAEARAELATIPPAHDDRIDHLREELAAVRDQLAAASLPPDAVGSPTPEQIRREIEMGLEDLNHRLEERLASAGGVSQSADREQFDAETERSLMAIERLGLRLGEHDRALAELMGSRGVTRRLDELASRIEDLAANGAGGGDASSSGRSSGETSADLRALARRLDDAEESSRADREKLLTRIEKMVTRMDWRLQRLETGGDG